MILSLFPSFLYIEAAAEEKQKPTAKELKEGVQKSPHQALIKFL